MIDDLCRSRKRSDCAQRLVTAGLRVTRTRLDVCQTIFQAGDRHFTTDCIYCEMQSTGLRISLASVYNTLTLLANHRIIQRLPQFCSQAYFDTNLSIHVHVYDEETGQLSDADAPLADKVLRIVPDTLGERPRYDIMIFQRSARS